MKTWDDGYENAMVTGERNRMEMRNREYKEALRTGGAASGGLTVRDHFAAMAMQALIEKMDETPFDVADEAYDFADAMLERRSGEFDAKDTVTVEEAFGL